MEGKVRFGMIGAGFAAGFFAQSFPLVERAELVGVTSLDRKLSEEFAARHGIPRVFDSREDLLASKEIDAVYIATFPNDHKASMLAALNAGKHVLCEKPFCLSVEDAQEVFAFAQEKGLLAMEAMRGEFLPMTLDIRRRLEAGEIGKLQSVIATMGFRMNPMEGKSRVFQKEMGGGCLFELGCYCVNSILGLLGFEPEQLSITRRMSPEYDVDLSSTIVMKYSGGITGTAISSIEGNIPSLLTICGSKGHITVPKFHFAQSCELYRNDNFFPVFPADATESLSMPYESSNEQYETQAFTDSILAGETVNTIMPPERTIGILKVIEAAISKQVEP